MVKAAAPPNKHTVCTTTVCHAGQQWHNPHTVTQDSSNNQV